MLATDIIVPHPETRPPEQLRRLACMNAYRSENRTATKKKKVDFQMRGQKGPSHCLCWAKWSPSVMRGNVHAVGHEAEKCPPLYQFRLLVKGICSKQGRSPSTASVLLALLSTQASHTGSALRAMTLPTPSCRASSKRWSSDKAMTTSSGNSSILFRASMTIRYCQGCTKIKLPLGSFQLKPCA